MEHKIFKLQNNQSYPKRGYCFLSRFKVKKSTEQKSDKKNVSVFNTDFHSEEKYKELTDALPQIVFQTDSQKEITFLNENALLLFGYTNNDFNDGLNLYKLFDTSEISNLKKLINKIFSNKESLYNEFKVKKKNGEIFSVLAHIVPKIRDGEIVGLRGVMMNISKQKRIEKLLASKRELGKIPHYD